MSFADNYNEAQRQALEEVKKQARLILKRNAKFEEFVMGMGTWTFTHRNGNYVEENDKRVKVVADIIYEWDNVLKITGNSVRFTAYGPEVTDW